MELWLLVIPLLTVIWFVVLPRTEKKREDLALRVSFLPTGASQREKFKLALDDAISARGTALNLPSDFSIWLHSLNNKQTDELLHQVAETCQRANVDLNWLLAARAQGEMARALQDTVLNAALAMYRAHALEPFARLESYRQNPNARGNQKFGQQVFAKLVDASSMTIPANLMLASEKERRTFAHAAIEQAAQENQDALIAIVRDVMNGKNGAAKKIKSETKALASTTANIGV